MPEVLENKESKGIEAKWNSGKEAAGAKLTAGFKAGQGFKNFPGILWKTLWKTLERVFLRAVCHGAFWKQSLYNPVFVFVESFKIISL